MSTPAAQALEGAGSTPAAAPSAPAAAPIAAPPAAQTPAANEGFWKDWQAPEQKDVRDWVSNKNFSDPFTLAKSARELETSVASLRAQANLKGYPADKVNPDGTVVKADDNARKAWNAAVGVPESADKYEIKLPENTAYPQFAKYMAEGMLEVGVPAAMAPKLAAAYEAAVTKLQTELAAQENAKSEEGLLQLQKDWGAKYQENLSLANRARAFFTKEVGGMTPEKERTLEAVLGTPTWLNLLAKIGAGNKEPGFAGSDTPSTFGNSASAAQAELDKITAERTAGTMTDHAWREFDKPGGRREQLIETIVGGMAK
jgi:hypothetical protein